MDKDEAAQATLEAVRIEPLPRRRLLAIIRMPVVGGFAAAAFSGFHRSA
jgi:hypothetical protein